MSFYPALEPVVIENGVLRLFQTADGKRHLWPSNFFVRPIYIGGILVASLEHYYQAMKSTDRAARDAILMAETPGLSKKLGRKVALRPDWPYVMNTTMWTGIHEKFAVDTDLAGALMETGDAKIIEGNYWHDQIWGDCACGRRECAAPGENRLGRMLMRRREILHEVS